MWIVIFACLMLIAFGVGFIARRLIPSRHNLGEAMAVVRSELARIQEEPATEDELARAKENLKGRVLLALESTGARMNRLGSELLAGAPLLSLLPMNDAPTSTIWPLISAAAASSCIIRA